MAAASTTLLRLSAMTLLVRVKLFCTESLGGNYSARLTGFQRLVMQPVNKHVTARICGTGGIFNVDVPRAGRQIWHAAPWIVD